MQLAYHASLPTQAEISSFVSATLANENPTKCVPIRSAFRVKRHIFVEWEILHELDTAIFIRVLGRVIASVSF